MSRDRQLRYIEKCENHTGPAWIGYVQTSRSGRTTYFNGRAFLRAHGRDLPCGNHIELGTGDEYWISGVKKRGTNRHWAGSGPILVEEAAVPELLALLGVEELDRRFQVTRSIVPTDIEKFHAFQNHPLSPRGGCS